MKKYIFTIVLIILCSCVNNKEIDNKNYDDLVITISNIFNDYYINNLSFSANVSDYNLLAQENYKFNLSDSLKKHNLKIIFIDSDVKKNIGYLVLKSNIDFNKSLNENQLLNFISKYEIKKTSNLNYVDDNVLLYIENEYSLIFQSSSIPLNQSISKFWKNKINYFCTFEIEKSNFIISDNLEFKYHINDSVLFKGKLHNNYIRDLLLKSKSKSIIKGFKNSTDFYFTNTIIELDSVYDNQKYYLLENFKLIKLKL